MVSQALIALISLYQKTLSPDHGLLRPFFPYGACRFHPTCSEHAKEAIKKHGLLTGTKIALKRLARCHPLSPITSVGLNASLTDPFKLLFRTLLYQPLFNLFILLAALWPFPGNVAFAVIGLTLIVRLLLAPFSRQTIKSQQAMHKIQPELQRLKEQYKDDQAKIAQETMALYRRHGINPAAGCLPLLIQLPILIILFYLFRDIYRHDLLYAPLLSRFPSVEDLKAALDTSLFGIDLTKPDPWILPIVTGLLQFWQSRQMMPRPSETKTHEGADFQRLLGQQMTYIFPLMTIFISRTLPAALPLSWSVTTLFMVGQQWWFTRTGTAPDLGSVEVSVRHSKKGK